MSKVCKMYAKIDAIRHRVKLQIFIWFSALPLHRFAHSSPMPLLQMRLDVHIVFLHAFVPIFVPLSFSYVLALWSVWLTWNAAAASRRMRERMMTWRQFVLKSFARRLKLLALRLHIWNDSLRVFQVKRKAKAKLQDVVNKIRMEWKGAGMRLL